MCVANWKYVGKLGEGRAPSGALQMCVPKPCNTLRNLIKVNTSQMYDYSQRKAFRMEMGQENLG